MSLDSDRQQAASDLEVNTAALAGADLDSLSEVEKLLADRLNATSRLLASLDPSDPQTLEILKQAAKAGALLHAKLQNNADQLRAGLRDLYRERFRMQALHAVLTDPSSADS
jgi:glutamine synthetase adenylyltransferase